MRSCITDVIALLLDLVEDRDLMIPINVRKHLGEKLRPVFAIIHHLEGVLESSGIPKQGGDSVNPIDVKPKPTVKLVPVVKSKSGLKGKDKLFFDDPIIDNEEEEEELKRRKAREEEMDRHQRIIREAEAKEKAEKEAQLTLERRKLLFPKWTLKHL
ncbi:unnamed protein product [Lactuca saligna]|uniref:Uncharacterized protein n=1 Tax=Lactuca saligna TaxID=75948 RepID=A0AA35Z591_LACSI|nr:unnamed protein product [Lactuca saligna]